MIGTINGIHHISAIVGKVNEAVDFYENILGLRLIKQTVNFDDPNTYHLYFSNESVDNGTIFTFFPWEMGKSGRQGSGQVGRIAFLVGKGQLEYWRTRLSNFGISVKDGEIFDRASLDFSDKHALKLSIVESDKEGETPNLLGFYAAEIYSLHPKASQDYFVDYFDFTFIKETENHIVLKVGNKEHFIFISKEVQKRGVWGTGTVHHIAFNAKDRNHLQVIHNRLAENNHFSTEIKDRKYFQSIYIQEVGGVILEFATKGPGFTVDEELEELGSHLMLPVQFEPYRQEIEANLIPIQRKVR